MQKLEKILAEIDIKIAGSMGKKREGLLEAREIIRKHMWPLTIIPPTCREAWIVNSADTFISLMETIASRKRFGKMKEYWVHRPLRAMYDQSAKELDLFV